MVNYARVFSELTERAVLDGGIDLETFITRLLDNGVSLDAIQERLLTDLETGGPIFGKFIRSITGSAQSSVITATRQGEILGQVIEDDALRERLGVQGDELEEAFQSADPDAAEELEIASQDLVLLTNVAELRNTCPECLPLHGKTLTRREWRESGLLPEDRHQGWTSACHCRLIPNEVAENRKELIDPLVRERIESPTGLKANKRTARSVTQRSLEKSQAAIIKASESARGRRTLRLLGQARKDLEE